MSEEKLVGEDELRGLIREEMGAFLRRFVTEIGYAEEEYAPVTSVFERGLAATEEWFAREPGLVVSAGTVATAQITQGNISPTQLQAAEITEGAEE